MILNSLQIENFRNLARVDIEADNRLNCFFGVNGAGKTSVLEAIVVLSRGRSFRTNQAAELVGPQEKTFSVFGKVRDADGRQMRLGLQRSGKRWRGRVNGQDLGQLSQLTRRLPVVLMEPDSHLLVSGSPEVRRKYLDWGMFHVKHGFLDTWRRYARTLKQRNAALRGRQTDILDTLDEMLAGQGEALSLLREDYVEVLGQRVGEELACLSERVGAVSMQYDRGWSGFSLYDSLSEQRMRDMERGQTQSGPHRADLTLRCDGLAARAVLSRGEQKAFAAALLLTQAFVMSGQGNRPLVLLDDLMSEFDRRHFKKVLQRFLALDSQVWMTGTGQPKLHGAHRMFHVEQGRIAAVV